MTKIREAKQVDSKAINIISIDLGYDIAPYDIADQRINNILKSKIDKLWVYSEDNQIKGWIHVFIANRVASSSFAEIGGLVVSSHFRRKGIGKHLAEHAMEWANINKLKIRVRCNTKRAETHLFYKAVGFSEIKSQHILESGICT